RPGTQRDPAVPLLALAAPHEWGEAGERPLIAPLQDLPSRQRLVIAREACEVDGKTHVRRRQRDLRSSRLLRRRPEKLDRWCDRGREGLRTRRRTGRLRPG